MKAIPEEMRRTFDVDAPKHSHSATGHGRNVAYKQAGTATTEYAKTHLANTNLHFLSGSPENVRT